MAYSSDFTKSLIEKKKKKKQTSGYSSDFTKSLIEGTYESSFKKKQKDNIPDENKYFSFSVKDKVTPEDQKKIIKNKISELDNKINNYDRKKNEWWHDDKNFFENLGNVGYKLFLETNPYEEDPKFDALVKERQELQKQLEDIYVANQELDTLDKIGHTFVGNFQTAGKGIESTITKILGGTPEDVDLTLEEKLAQKSRQETDGIGGFGLDVLGSVARMLPQMAVGNPTGAMAVGFANYGGGAYNEARREGYTDEQATMYGITVGTLEMTLEKVLGGFESVYGKSAMSRVTEKVMSKVISNPAFRQAASGMAGEFTEEYLQEFLEPIVKNVILEEENGADFWNTMEKDFGEGLKQLGSQFFNEQNVKAGFTGAVTSGLVGGQSTYDAYVYNKTTGRDLNTGLTANEQTVVDNVTNERTTQAQKEKVLNTEINKEIKEFESTFGTMTEAEKTAVRDKVKEKLDSGEIDYTTSKLSKKEIARIKEEVRSDLEKGYIDIDTIESTLSSEKTAQIKELEQQLANTKGSTKKAEIEAKINELRGAKATELKSMLEKDTYLQKSYMEADLKTKQFTYEAKDTDSEYKKSLAKDFEKVANDTTRSHELFETLSKIAEDKETNYGVINNAQLKQLGFEVEGKQVNGLVRNTKDGKKKVLINIDSAKALNTIVGHETTHLLEGTTEYAALQEVIFNYAKEKGDFNTRQRNLNSLYEGVDADVDSELTADLVGDYLFTDKEFIETLSTQKPTVFQKIKDLIDDLVVRFTGTKEERQLREVQKKFREAYKQSGAESETQIGQQTGQQVEQKVDTKLSITDNLGRTLTKEQQEFFKDSKVRDENGNLLTVYHGTRADFNVFESERAGQNYENGWSQSGKGFYFTDDIKEAQEFGEYSEGEGKTNVKEVYLNITNPFDTSQENTPVLAEIGKEYGVDSHFLQRGDYLLRWFRNNDINASEVLQKYGFDGIFDYGHYVAYESNQIKSVDNTKPTESQDIRYSLTDNQGRTLTKEQQEFFKDSKVRDENGNLLTMYHGSPNEFTIFDKNKAGSRGSWYGTGFYFTEDWGAAQHYSTNQGELENGVVYESYLDIENPYVPSEDKILEDGRVEFAPEFKDDFKNRFSEAKDIENLTGKQITEILQKNGYDGIHNGEMWVAFEPNQIKNVDNTNPTSDADIRYSLSEDTQGRKLTDNQKEYFKNEDKKLLDENGKLKVLYHGTPFGNFTTFKGNMFFFSEDYRFAEDYANSKSFEQGLDGDIKVVEAYLKAENVFDVTDSADIQKLREALSDEINFWGRIWDKETLLKKLQRKDTLPPKWKSEQIEGKQFGDYIGDDRNGYNTDMFVGVNEQNEIVYISQERDLQKLSQTEKDMFQEQLMSGKEVSYVTYQTIYGEMTKQGIQEKISELQKQGEEYKKENGFENEAIDYYIKELEQTLKWLEKDLVPETKHKLKPKTATQESTELTDIDNWTYFETAYDPETRKDVVDIVRDLGYDAINIYEEGKSNYIVFNPNQIKNVTNQNPTDNPDINMSLSNLNEILPTRQSNLTYGEDVRLEVEEAIAPLKEEIAELKETLQNSADTLQTPVENEYVPVQEQAETTQPTKEELDNLEQIRLNKSGSEYALEFYRLRDKYGQTNLYKGINEYKTQGETYEAPIKEAIDEYVPVTEEQLPIGEAPVENKETFTEEEIIERTKKMQKIFAIANKNHKPLSDEFIEELTKQNIEWAKRSGKLAPADNVSNTNKTENIAPIRSEAIRPKPTKSNEPKMTRVKEGTPTEQIGRKQRKWVETSTESDVVNREILPDDLDQTKITYQPISNRSTLNKANTKLDTLGYDDSVTYFNSQIMNKKTTVEDIALGERLIQEAMKKGDTKTAGELIQNVAILGTELGQKVQALSIIQRMTPEGQLKMLQKTVNRGKVRGDKAFDNVEITQEMIDKILKTYNKNGTYDQKELNKAVEDVKQQIANNMKTTTMEKVNAWRYLAMLGNPKTHIRNLVSNVAMKGTLKVKNALARTIETVAPIKGRTKTWEQSSEAVKQFAKQTTLEMKEIISEDNKYNEETSIKAKRQTFKTKILESAYNFNSELLTKEDWWFSKGAFEDSFSEYLTANGIKTKEDIKKNTEIIEKAKGYALEQSQIATFRQYSWLANKIRDIENKNAFTQMAVGSVIPFKKTPINIAKAGLSYSPLGFAKTLTYDIAQVKKGNMEASKLIDNLSQNATGTGLTLLGYMLASAGFLSGGGDDDEEGKYDYNLGEQSYSINIGGNSYSLSWLSPVAMPLFVGANAYEQLVEGEEWNGDVVLETLAQTLDPLSEMSFLSGLDTVLSSYDSGMQKFAGIGESMVQNYLTQFVPTFSSQIASTLDDKKRSTKVAKDSDFRIVDETYNKLIYKIPFLRETLEPSTDIWGNEVKQNENLFERAFENFIAPYSRKGNIATEIDEELKDLYSETGESGILPKVPYNYVNFNDEKYEMSAKEYTDFKKTYGQTANDMLEDLFKTTTYKNATTEDRVDMVGDVYEYARDKAKKEYLAKEDVEYTNATKDGVEYFKEHSIKGAIANDMPVEEYDYYIKNPTKYNVITQIDTYENYNLYKDDIADIKEQFSTDNGYKTEQRKYAVQQYINSLSLSVPQKIMLEKMAGGYSIKDYENYMYEYINSLPLTAAEKQTMHNQLFD